MAAAAGTGMVKAAASSSDSEACVTNLPAPGDAQAPAAADDEGKAQPAGIRRRTKLVPVSQYYIDIIKEDRAVNPRLRGPVWNEEMMASFYKDNPEGLETSRSLYAKAAAVFKADEEREDEILKQYNASGSAFMEVEISDDDDN